MSDDLKAFLVRLQRSIDVCHDDITNEDYRLAQLTLDRLSSEIDEQLSKEMNDERS